MKKPAKSSKKRRVVCANCKHYYVTWDIRYPYGCKALNFKTSNPPYLSVFQNSGMECQMYSPKKKEKIK